MTQKPAHTRFLPHRLSHFIACGSKDESQPLQKSRPGLRFLGVLLTAGIIATALPATAKAQAAPEPHTKTSTYLQANNFCRIEVLPMAHFGRWQQHPLRQRMLQSCTEVTQDYLMQASQSMGGTVYIQNPAALRAFLSKELESRFMHDTSAFISDFTQKHGL